MMDYESAVKQQELLEWSQKLLGFVQAEGMTDVDLLSVLGFILSLMLRDEPYVLKCWVKQLRNRIAESHE